MITNHLFSPREKGYSLSKLKSSTRIVMLGDSFTYGYRLPYRDTLPKQLEKILNDKLDNHFWEVIGITRGSLSFLDYLSLYKSFAQGLEADLVVIVLCRNDCSFDDDPLPEEIVDWDQRSLKFFDKYLNELCAAIRTNGAEPLLLYYHTITGEPPWFGVDNLPDILNQICKKHDCAFFNTGMFFKNYSYKVVWVAENDWHPSAFAHRITAVEFVRLIEKGYIFKKRPKLLHWNKLVKDLAAKAAQPGVSIQWSLSKFYSLAKALKKHNKYLRIKDSTLTELKEYLLKSRAVSGLTVGINGLNAARGQKVIDHIHRIGKDIESLKAAIANNDDFYLHKYINIKQISGKENTVKPLHTIIQKIRQQIHPVFIPELSIDTIEAINEYSIPFHHGANDNIREINNFIDFCQSLLASFIRQADLVFNITPKCRTKATRRAHAAIYGQMLASLAAFIQNYLRDSSLLLFMEQGDIETNLPEEDLYHNWQGLQLFGTISGHKWNEAVKNALPAPLWGHINQGLHAFNCNGRANGDIHVVTDNKPDGKQNKIIPVHITNPFLKRQFTSLIGLMGGRTKYSEVDKQTNDNFRLFITDCQTIEQRSLPLDSLPSHVAVITSRLDLFYVLDGNFNDLIQARIAAPYFKTTSNNSKTNTLIRALTIAGGKRPLGLMDNGTNLLSAYLQLLSHGITCDFFIGTKHGNFLHKEMLTCQEASTLKHKPYILIPEGPQQISGIASIWRRQLLENGFQEKDFTKTEYFIRRIYRSGSDVITPEPVVTAHPITWLNGYINNTFLIADSKDNGWTLTMRREAW